MTAPDREVRTARAIRNTGLACLGLACAMVGAAYAAVPLYDIFCRMTGYDGRPMVGTAAPDRVLGRTVSVRFDANVAPGLGWSFVPETPVLEVPIGATQTTFFRVRNDGYRASTGIAAYNVQPGQAGSIFVKLKCFCFEEQVLRAGETIAFPVVFYIDPSIAENRDLDGLNSITLSYTYFASKNGQPVASADGAKPRL